MTSSKCEIVPMRDVLWHACLRKARWDVGVVTGVYHPPGIAGIEQLRLRHPARLGVWPLVLAAGRLHPLAEMGEERGGVLLEAVAQEEWHTAGRQHLDDLV